MEIMRLKTTTKMIIDAHQLSWVYHINYMINDFLWYVSTGVLHGPAELACRTLHDLAQDAGCFFVPAQIFPGGKYLVFNFQGVKVSSYHLWTQLDIYPL